MKLLLFLLLSLIFATLSNGQVKTKQPVVNKPKTIPTRQLKIKKPTGRHQDDNIFCMLQDKAGNLWFGTSSGEGVYRYDGKSFTNFTEKDGLPGNDILSILQDKSGIIWFGTISGLSRYDGKTFTTIPITIGSSSFYPTVPVINNSPAKNEVWSIYQDKSGKLWFGTKDGVYCYNGISFTRFLDHDGVINDSGLHLKMVSRILEDKAGNIWFCSGVLGFEGICRYDGKSIRNFKPNGDTWIRSVLEDKKGSLWFVTRHEGAGRYDGKTFTNFTQKGGLDNWNVTCILEDRAGNLWFGEDKGNDKGAYYGGLWRYDGKTFTKFTTKDGLSNNGVDCIMEDKAGNIWAGSRCNGLSRYDGKTFTSFTE